jgi:basic membrane protein A
MNRRTSLILFLALTLSACTPTPQDCAKADVFCAGLVTASGPVSDNGVNQQAWFGLQDAKAAGLVDRIDYIETVDSRDRAKNIEFFAENGYDVIITVGSSLSDDTIAAAQKYPNLKFIGVEQEQTEKYPNVTGLVFHEDQSGFMAGALAAMITQTNHVGAVCEANFIDAMRRYCDGFRAGALYLNPNIDVRLAYRDGSQEKLFNDPGWGSATASQMVSDGADVLFAAGGGTADAALETAASDGVYVIGSETDVYARLKEIRRQLVSSAVNEIRSGLLDLMRLAKEGQLPPGDYFGQTSLAPFHDFENQIAPGVSEKLDAVRLKLENNTLKTEVPYLNP